MKYSSISLALVLGLAGCGGGGEPSGATCPDTSTLTYASFGEGFMAAYCTDCHSVDASPRNGAPRSVNFDTQAEIQDELDAIDREAGKGPNATNTSMPPSAAEMFPTDAEREQLAEWLACGAP